MSDSSWEAGFDSPDPEQRRLAVARLANVVDPRALDLAVLALGDEEWRVRKEAVTVVVAKGSSSALLDVLIGTFSTSDNVGLRNAVSEVLAGLGRPAVDRIATELPRLDADGRKLAAEALGRTRHQSAAAVLMRLLSDPDVNVRVAASEAFGSLGCVPEQEVIALLCSALDSPVSLERLAALESMNTLGVVIDWELLEPLVAVPVLERAALMAAVRSSAPSVADCLAHALIRFAPIGDVWPVQALAEYALRSQNAMRLTRGALARLDVGVRQALWGLMSVDDTEVRTAAIVVVSVLGDEEASVRVLEAVDRDELTGAAEHLVDAIARLNPSVLVRQLSLGTNSQREQILRAVARYPTILPVESVLEEVARIIETEEESVRGAALEVLASISNERCLRLLVERFARLPNSVRRTAVVVLGEMVMREPHIARAIIDAGGFGGETCVPVTVMVSALARGGNPASVEDMELLTRCLLANESSVRCAALEALAEIGDSAAADAIAFLIADEEQEVRLAAVRALGRLRADEQSTAVVGRLISLAQQTDDRELLVVALQAIGETRDPRVLAVLRPLVEAAEPSVAVAAVEAVSRLVDTRRVEVLTLGLAHSDSDVVKTAMRMLATQADARVDSYLGQCLEHADWGIRRLAADLLGQRGGDLADGLVRARQTVETEPLVREALERAVGVIAGPLPPRRGSSKPEKGSWRPR